MTNTPELELFRELMEWCKGGSVTLLSAYFDESEQDGQFCVAGFAFAPQHELHPLI